MYLIEYYITQKRFCIKILLFMFFLTSILLFHIQKYTQLLI